MKCNRKIGVIIALGFVLALAAQTAPAATLTWNKNTFGTPVDGAGIWSTGTNWWSASSGTVQVWNNANGDTALFGNTPGGSTAFAVTVTGSQSVGGITFQNEAYSLGVTTGGTINLAGAAPVITVNSSSGGTLNSVVLTGNAGLTKSGSSLLYVTGLNPGFFGNVTVSSGTLIGQSGTALGDNGQSITLGDANTGANNIMWQQNGGSATGPLVVSTSGSGTAIVALGNAALNLFYDANITLNRATTIQTNTSGAVNLNPSGSGSLSGSCGTLTITNLSTGATNIEANNSGLVGTVVLAHGAINALNASALGTSNPVIMQGSTVLSLSGANLTIGALTGASGNTINTALNGIDNLTVSSGTASTYAGGITGGGGLTLASGTLTLSGTNTYSGGTNVNGGLLRLGSGTLGGPTSPLTLSGGTLDLAGFSASAGTLGGNSGVITASAGNSVLTTTMAANSTYSGSIAAGAGVLGLTKAGAGILTLNGVNSYTGTTTISGGGLIFAAPSAFSGGTSSIVIAGGVLAATGPYTTVNDWLNSGKIAASPTSGAIAILANDNENIDLTMAGTGSYQGSYGSLSIGSIGNNIYGGTLIPGANGYLFGGGGGVITLTQSLSGAYPLVAGSGGFGGGEVILAATNSYTGNTTIGGGTL